MEEEHRSKEQLVAELHELRRRVAELEKDKTGSEGVEEDLRQSEERFRQAMEASSDGLWDWDITTDHGYFSPAYYRMLGYEPNEFRMTGHAWADLIHPDDRDRTISINRDCIENRIQAFEVEYRMKARDGSWKWILGRGRASSRDAQGSAVRMTGTHVDITERKQAEETLRTTVQRFHKILSDIFVGILVVTEDDRIEHANQDFCDQFNIAEAPSDLIGLTAEEMLLKVLPAYADPAADLARIRQIVSRRDRIEGEEILMHDGRVLLRDYIPISVDGQPRGRMWQHRDITERKKYEEALEERDIQFKKLSLNVPGMIYQFMKRPDGTYCVPFTTEAIKDIFGCSPQDVLMDFTPVTRVVFPEDLDKLIDSIESSAERMTTWQCEYRVQIPGRPIRWMYGQSTPEKLADGSIVWYGFNTDITEPKRIEDERRRLEERLRRAEKMEALGTLAGGVAHDLNNVLGVVVGYSELLLYAPDLSGPAKSKATEILKGGQKAAAIVQDLLTLARRGIQDRNVLNLNRVLIECQRSPEFAKVLSGPNIMLKTDLEMDLLNISGSPIHLEKSLINLVSNAVEAMPCGGTLTIRTCNQYLDRPLSGYDTVREGDYVVLSVSDTGEGISAADLKRIFEPFYTKKVMGRSGTGLGLAVVWGTVKDHYGYVNVESEEGKGTTFTLYFPITREDITAEQVSLSAAEYMGNGESILVVDDVKEQRELAMEMLTKQNYRVTTVSSGEQALEYLKLHQVDLVVLDMIMDPGMDGLDTYSKILEIHPGQKAIIVSGFSETERVCKAQALGAGAYVKKPYVLEKLGMAVRQELDRPE